MTALDVVADQNVNKTGDGTKFSEENINNMPTVECGMYDIAKLVPYVVEEFIKKMNKQAFFTEQ